MPLTVLSVAFPFAPVRPEVAGGAEQILLALDRALVESGHRSIVIAAENSIVRGELIGTPVWNELFENDSLETIRDEAARCHRNAIEAAIARFAPDVVHYHGFDFHLYAARTDAPSLATLHLPPDHYPAHVLANAGIKLFCVSESQKQSCPQGALIAGVVPNGIDTQFFSPRGRARNYAIALGRICPKKGFHLALDAAKIAGIPLLLAGEVFAYDAHRRYFDEEILPRLDRHRKFIGAIAPARKCRLLAGARCLIAPSLIDETSSLTAMEALACGTPVIARPAGALRYVVEDWCTGFLANTVEEIAARIGRIGAISRLACRASALERFALERMVSLYFDVWESLASSRTQSACSN